MAAENLKFNTGTTSLTKMIWPFNLIWPKKPELVTTPAQVILEVQDAKEDVANDLRNVFLEATKQAAVERAQLEAQLLNNGKLAEYLRSTIRHLASELLKHDTSEEILLGHYDCKVPESVFADYCELFLKIGKEFGLGVRLSGKYIWINRASAKKILSNLMPDTPRPDMEKLREVLRQGPYR